MLSTGLQWLQIWLPVRQEHTNLRCTSGKSTTESYYPRLARGFACLYTKDAAIGTDQLLLQLQLV